MANRQKTVYVCAECGSETPNWAGKCPSCGAWNTLEEMRIEKGSTGRSAAAARSAKPRRLEELEDTEEIRFSTGISEFDRVLGGGAVLGSLILVGGAPGIGKSTLLLQMCAVAGRSKRILYVSVSSSFGPIVLACWEERSMSWQRRISDPFLRRRIPSSLIS